MSMELAIPIPPHAPDAPGPELSRADIEGVGFDYLQIDEALDRFLPDGVDIADPGLGLWRI